LLRPLQDVSFNTDDIDTATVSKTFRVRFDRNLYYVAAADMWRGHDTPWRIGQRNWEHAT
jgi:hypothetical protein